MANININKMNKSLSKWAEDNHERTIKLVSKEWARANVKGIISKILEFITKGQSPVKGYGRFEKYSASYTKAIRAGRYGSKKTSPVNLTVSGKMLKSMSWRAALTGFSVFFSSKIAKYHNGEGRVDRRIMPIGDESWKDTILTDAKEDLKKRIKKEFLNGRF